MCKFCKWECKMFYKDKLYTGYYWGKDYSLARAIEKVEELQRLHPVMRFELSDHQTGNKIILN